MDQIVTLDELDQILEFIDYTLHREFDQYLDHVICKCPWEEGKRRMNPQIYDLAKAIRRRLHDQDA